MRTILLCLFLLSVSLHSRAQEQIIFSSTRNGNSDIFMMDNDGKVLVQLTYNDAEEWGPTLINKNEITFLRQESESIVRVHLNLESAEETVLLHPKECVLDDKNIKYAPKSGHELYSCNGNMYLKIVDQSTAINITSNLSGTSKYGSWSPTGQNILFTNNSTGNNDVYVYELPTQEIKNLTNSPANDERGELSPGGTHLLFSSNRHNNNQELFITNIESGQTSNITNSPGTEFIGRWSKDGKRIYFGSNKDGNWEIYSYSLSDGKTLRLTQSNAFDGDPRVR